MSPEEIARAFLSLAYGGPVTLLPGFAPPGERTRLTYACSRCGERRYVAVTMEERLAPGETCCTSQPTLKPVIDPRLWLAVSLN